MLVIKDTIYNLKRYKDYIFYSIKSIFKKELAGKFLGAFWWILDPIFLMLTYVLMVNFIFKRGTPDYPIFVFSALIAWKWTSTSFIVNSRIINSYFYILKNIYIPKFIIPLIWCLVELIYFIFGILALFILKVILRSPFSWHILQILPIMLSHFIFIYGISLIFAHIGVYLKDLSNILNFVLRLWFYLSPGIWAIDKAPEIIKRFVWLNPMTTYFENYRSVLMYQETPNYLEIGIWTLINVVILFIGLAVLHRSDRNYVKIA